MFDTYRVDAAPAYPQTITRHEHRAPTDDSIRLAREYEDRAVSYVAWSYTFGENDIKGSVVGVKYPTGERRVVISFTLNGEKHQLIHQVQETAFRLDRATAYRAMLTDFATQFAKMFANECVGATR